MVYVSLTRADTVPASGHRPHSDDATATCGTTKLPGYCRTGSRGQVRVTYRSATTPARGNDTLTAALDPYGTARSTDAYTYPAAAGAKVTRYNWNPAPIAAPGSLAVGQAVTLTLTPLDAARAPVPQAPVLIIFTRAPGSNATLTPAATATCTRTGGTSKPRLRCRTDAAGHVALTYTTSTTQPSAGSDAVDATSVTTAAGATRARVPPAALDTYSYVLGPLQVTAPHVKATFGTSVSQGLRANVSGGLAPYTFTASPLDSMSVDPSTGVISGTADAPCPGGGTTVPVSGSSAIEVRCPTSTFAEPLTVTDAYGTSVTVTLTLTVSIPPLIFDPVSSLPDLSDGDSYDQQAFVNGVTPSGGYGPAVMSTSRVSVTGPSPHPDNNGLPCNQVGCSGTAGTAELTINSSTGEISGMLSDVIAGQDWTFEVHLTDTDPLNSSNTIMASYQLSISAS